MKLEVTEQEAKGIYRQRYIREKVGNKFLYLIIYPLLFLSVVVGWWVMSVNDWLGFVVFAVLVLLPVGLVVRKAKRAKAYACSQIAE